MLNAFYRGLKSVDRSAIVVTAGTAPFGDPGPGGPRIMPALFWRDLLCLRQTSGDGLRGAACPDPAHFDVMAHHPYSVGAPTTRALNADDVSIPDLGKLTRLMRFAERSGRALPRIHHPLWVTEVGYNTKPPNPFAVPIDEAGRWLEETLELLWKQGVSLVTWNTIVDQPPVPDYSSTSQSGVYFLDGRAKAAPLAAFRFPLVGWRTRGQRGANVWGRAPVGGHVVVEERSGSSWRALATVGVARHGVFELHVGAAPDRSELRAVTGQQVSLPWRL
jgi:hypothetical protein